MNMLFMRKEKESKNKRCDSKECTQEILKIHGDFKDFVKKLRQESEEEFQKNGSWLKSAVGK